MSKVSSQSSRRHFLRASAAAALGFAGLGSFAGCATGTRLASTDIPLGFDAFVPDPDGIMDLPPGFTYRVLSRAGERMDDGLLVPARHDGMAAFPGPDGLTILVRNHEVGPRADAREGAFGPNNELLGARVRDRLYDAGSNGSPCLGGTTTLLYDTRSRELVGHRLSLAGTLVNCAGGPTPWNTWISCEETTDTAGDRCERDHGYCFEVPTAAIADLVHPEPLKAMGRFKHEAVAVNPSTGVVYQTEDLGNGLIYRFIPKYPGELERGGRLQALAVRDAPSYDMRNWDETRISQGQSVRVSWIDLDDVEAPDNDLRLRGFEAGAARFARGEGMWYGNDAVYFACTNGGPARLGQVWKYTPGPVSGVAEEEGTLELFVEATDAGLIEHCDNVTVAPWGDLVLCEDGSGSQYLVGITPGGDIYRFARNALSESELAGATFSPDGSTLFINIQHDGLTLAITGPWERRQPAS